MVCLTLKAQGILNPETFPFIDSPGDFAFKSACLSLSKMGAIDETGNITQLGKIMHEFPLDPYSSFCIFNLIHESESIRDDILTIISILNGDNFYISLGKDKNREESIRRKQFSISNSDHLTKLNIFYKFISASNKKEFCRHFGLKRKSLDTIIMIRDQLKNTFSRILNSLNFNQKIEKNGQNGQAWRNSGVNMNEMIGQIKVNQVFDRTRIMGILKRCFFHRIAKLTNFGEYCLIDSSVKAKIHPESVVFGSQNKPKEIIFHSLINTSRLYLNNVSEL